MKTRLRWALHAQVAAIAIGTVACGNSDAGGTEPVLPGSISVRTQTSGFAKDDSYELMVGEVDAGTIGSNDELTIAELDPATYTVALTDVADNCTVEAASATVASSETTPVSMTVVCAAGDPSPYSLRANRDRPDLETGALTECSFGLCPTNEGWDLYVQFNTAASPQAVIRQNQTTGVQLAHVPGVTLASITEADVTGATLTADPIDDSFDSGRVILVRTDAGNVYALGNPVENKILMTLAFDAVLLVTAP
jgi:hypothetical protein